MTIPFPVLLLHPSVRPFKSPIFQARSPPIRRPKRRWQQGRNYDPQTDTHNSFPTPHSSQPQERGGQEVEEPDRRRGTTPDKWVYKSRTCPRLLRSSERALTVSVGSFRQSVPETTKSPLKLSSSPISDGEGGYGAISERQFFYFSRGERKGGQFLFCFPFLRVYSALSRSPLSPSGTPPSQLPSCSLSLSPLSDATFFVWEVLFGQGKDWPPDTGLLAALYFLHTCIG